MPPKRTQIPLEQRFWAKVNKTDDCWLWTGAKSGGYGKIKRSGRWVLAHRTSYELAFGPIPDGLFICHHCDHPLCVRPDHLFAGTHQDNMADMAAKGRAWTPRSLKGNRYRARLTAEQVLNIRRRCASGAERQADIAREYGILRGHVSSIVSRRIWRDI